MHCDDPFAVDPIENDLQHGRIGKIELSSTFNVKANNRYTTAPPSRSNSTGAIKDLQRNFRPRGFDCYKSLAKMVFESVTNFSLREART